MRKCERGTLRFILMTMAGVLMTAFFMTATVESRARGRLVIDEKYYEQMEREYVLEIKKQLEEFGIKNSGINMTYVSEDGSWRNYKVIIHNRQLKWMTPERQEELRLQIEGISFPSESCTFFHEFVADKEL